MPLVFLSSTVAEIELIAHATHLRSSCFIPIMLILTCERWLRGKDLFLFSTKCRDHDRNGILPLK